VQKISLLAIGSLKESWIRTGCGFYLSRLQRAFDVSVQELPASKEKLPEKQRDEELERVFRVLEQCGGEVWLLDEQGDVLTSQQFSAEISKRKDRGAPLTFVVGGAYGFTDAVRHRADHMLSLSAMTLPHELCRLLFFEQLYRASEIMKGSGYHHG